MEEGGRSGEGRPLPSARLLPRLVLCVRSLASLLDPLVDGS